MNIAFFLTPKSDVAWLPIRSTVRQALERMDAHRYTAVPLLDDAGRYVGTLTEGDLLRVLKKNPELTFHDTERLPLADVDLKVTILPVRIDAQLEELFTLVLDQNFAPVVDDRGAFIGIVRRRAVLEHFMKPLFAHAKAEAP
jgi:CBS-domain-containing membrane protein